MTAGPARLIANPMPRKSPVPMAPPSAIIDSLLAFRDRCRPDSRSAMDAKGLLIDVKRVTEAAKNVLATLVTSVNTSL